jgi:hypothetical protein
VHLCVLYGSQKNIDYCPMQQQLIGFGKQDGECYCAVRTESSNRTDPVSSLKDKKVFLFHILIQIRAWNDNKKLKQYEVGLIFDSVLIYGRIFWLPNLNASSMTWTPNLNLWVSLRNITSSLENVLKSNFFLWSNVGPSVFLSCFEWKRTISETFTWR